MLLSLSPPNRPPSASLRGPGGVRSAGFTLIELMVVVLILGLIGGATYISWEALLPSQQFNTAVRNLSEVLHGTRSDAIARNRPFHIYYDLDADLYSVRTPFKPGGGFAFADDEEHVWTEETSLAASGIDILQVTVEDQTYVEGSVRVAFDPLGASNYHTVVLRHLQFERDSTIEVMPLTGDIRFHDGFFEREPAQEEDFD